MTTASAAGPRELMKWLAHTVSTALVLPNLISYHVRAVAIGRDRALEGSSQLLALLPGTSGQYLRRAFLSRVLARFDRSAVIEFGTILSKADTRIDARVYIGPHCHLGLVHIEADVMLAAGVHVPSGPRTHGTDSVDVPMREQAGERAMVRIGRGAWIGSAAVVMADVGDETVVGAGAVVVRPLPARVVAGGVPAKVLRSREARDDTRAVPSAVPTVAEWAER
jgi:virginiamycin A acetyltransferase